MDWRFSTFLLALFALLIGFSIAPIGETMCRSSFVLDVLSQHNKDGAANCFEFWFNRYQTLIGVLGALGAAWATWVGVKRQIQRLDRQLQIARVQFASTYLDNITKRMSIVDNVIANFDQLKFYVGDFEITLQRFLDAAAANKALTSVEIADLYQRQQFRRMLLPQEEVEGEKVFEANENLAYITKNTKELGDKILAEIDNSVLTSQFHDNIFWIVKDTINLCGLIDSTRGVVMGWHETLGDASVKTRNFPKFHENYHQVKHQEYIRVTAYLEAERTRLQRLRDQTTDDADKALI